MPGDDNSLQNEVSRAPPSVSTTGATPAAEASSEVSETNLPVATSQGHVSTDHLVCAKAQDDSAGSEREAEVTMLPEEADRISCDGGWGWMVALGVFVNYVLLMGYLKSSGLFFVELVHRYQAPASLTALLFAVRNGVYCLCGFFVMNVLVGRVEIRRLVLLGGALMALSAILSSFAKQLTLFICLQSGLLAMGYSMLVSPGQVLVGQYFQKWRRNVALAFTECGVSVGNIAMPLLISFFLEEHALQGTLLLYGGICLHSLPAGMLHRPLTSSSKRPSRQQPEQKNASSKDAPADLDTALNRDDVGPGGIGEVADDFDGGQPSERTCVNPGDNRCMELGEADSMSAETQSIPERKARGSSQKETGDLGYKILSGSNDCLQETEPRKPSCCDRLLTFPLFSALNVPLFRDPMFRVFIVYSSICAFVNIPVDYLPALVSQHDVTESQAARLLSVIGGLDLVCRVTCGVIAGSNKVRVSTVVLSSYLALAVVMQFVRYMQTFQHFMVLAVIQGLLGSVGNCLFPQLVIELVGVEKMGEAIGWSQLMCGIIMTPVYPLLGYVRDLAGSYILVYHIIGIGLLAAGAALCFVRPVRHCQQRRQTARGHHPEPGDTTHSQGTSLIPRERHSEPGNTTQNQGTPLRARGHHSEPGDTT